MADLSNPLVGIPEPTRALLSRLHAKSIAQEQLLDNNIYEDHTKFDEVMRDKFIALDEDKSRFVYQLCRALGATTVVEAGTSYGVSTIYLASAVALNTTSGKSGRVIATEWESAKAVKARENWKACGQHVSDIIDLREGDILETLKENVDDVDFLLLDIWAPLAFPTLKIIQPKLRPGAVVVTDNTISGADRYKDLLAYLRDPSNGFITSTLPFNNGLEMSIYLPGK